MAAALAIAVLVAVAFAVSAAFTFAVIVMMVAVTLAVAAVMLLGRKEFPVQTLGQFLLGGFPDGNDFPAETQYLTGHRMVEVH